MAEKLKVLGSEFSLRTWAIPRPDRTVQCQGMEVLLSVVFDVAEGRSSDSR
ncbi:hypothetical protein METHB2_240016 [Candidatus Methylobacter favarea]|uniref:Uncharacterized protein n=1 Tax=Candidatus Methylobacter favarea TaxID=2707345 RepID=A0A8S0Y659_9GAMM|nr:hypothetical protein METHB2_240016 [Candidatus Methylobacter favarea]